MAEAQIPLTSQINTQQVAEVYDTTTSKTAQWNSKVTDCCEDIGICLCGAFVPCILACKVVSDYGECCCLPLVGGAVLAMRTGMRERYHIPGSICDDCVCLTFCGPCTLCQMARELKERKLRHRRLDCTKKRNQKQYREIRHNSAKTSLYTQYSVRLESETTDHSTTTHKSHTDRGRLAIDLTGKIHGGPM